RTIRDKFAFHNQDKDDLILQAYRSLQSDEDLVVYLARDVGNTLYHVSEVAVMRAIIDLYHPASPRAALEQFIAEATETAGWFTEFFNGFLMAFVRKHLGTTLDQLGATPISVTNAPPIDTVSIPFFTGPPVAT